MNSPGVVWSHLKVSSEMWSYCVGPGGPEISWLAWAYFNLTTPCAYRLTTAVINSLFLLVIGCFSTGKVWSLYQRKRSRRKSAGKENGANGSSSLHPIRVVSRVKRVYGATIALTGLGSVVFLVTLLWRFWVMFVSDWNYDSILEFTFAAIQFTSWFFFAGIVGHERRFTAERHPLSLRIWWIVTFVLSSWAFVSGVLQFMTAGSPYDPATLDDATAILIFFISLFLLVVAIRGETGLVMEEVSPELSEPLLDGDSDEIEGPLVTEFAKAGPWSKVTWYWVNSLLLRGVSSPLNASDVPFVAPDDRAEKQYDLFTSHWPKEETQHPVRLTLIRCFWPQLLFIALLAVGRLSVMYVGPMLIQRFVDFSSGAKYSSEYEGYYLTLILFVATVVQVLCAHHYNFQSQKLGMLVRASLITSVYQKGLRLTSSARQAHGLGQIVQYMSVDVQQLADVVIQVHNLWILPLQITVALTILYSVIGISMLAGLITMVTLVIITMLGSGQQKGFLTSLAKMRDSRLKATSEVLNNMKIIKLQAWEEHFRQRVEGFRKSEYGWLVKYWVSLSGNIFSLWISPSLVSVVTFGTCMLLSVELTPGIVFTATATFRILMEPVRLFPQALIAISQALVSLDRLDKFMMSRELDVGAVSRLPSGAERAVSVEKGSFTWDDESSLPSLSNVNIDVKRGSLVAVVGMVGSGKSSLLSSILGEMPKLSGTVYFPLKLI
jgi:ATP-binding cassette subfamily C (CFTR/MRP) protein 2